MPKTNKPKLFEDHTLHTEQVTGASTAQDKRSETLQHLDLKRVWKPSARSDMMQFQNLC
jgi:hypothetical protein